MCRPTIPHALCLDAFNTDAQNNAYTHTEQHVKIHTYRAIHTQQYMHSNTCTAIHEQQYMHSTGVDTSLVRNGAAKRRTKARGRKVVSTFHRA